MAAEAASSLGAADARTLYNEIETALAPRTMAFSQRSAGSSRAPCCASQGDLASALTRPARRYTRQCGPDAALEMEAHAILARLHDRGSTVANTRPRCMQLAARFPRPGVWIVGRWQTA